MNIDISKIDWFHGRPTTPAWYITGYIGSKAIYRYWFGEAWSEAVTTDSHFESYQQLGFKISLMDAAFNRYLPLDTIPEFLKQFDELVMKQLNKEKV